MLQSRAGLVALAGAAFCQISVSNILRLFLLQFIFKNFANILQKLFLNRYKFLIKALFSLVNGTLHQRFIVTALKSIYCNIVCFWLQTLEI